MRKLLILIAAMIMCNAYGDSVYWFTNKSTMYTNTPCTPGDNITKPTDPTKSGYRFIGWQEQSSGTSPIGPGLSWLANNIDTNGYSTTPSSSTSNPYATTWATNFQNGPKVLGEALCVAFSASGFTSAVWYIDGTPVQSGGAADNSCACHITHIASNIFGMNRWVNTGAFNGVDTCKKACAWDCANKFKNQVNFRKQMLKFN